MNGEAVEWLPAIAVLLAGLFGGVVLVLLSRGRRGRLAREAESESVKDLEEQRDLMIERLREMRDSGDVAARRQLENDTAGVLRRIEARKQDLERLEGKGQKAEPAPEPTRKSTSATGFLWGVGSAVVIGLIVILVANSATERDEGGSVTGGVGMTAAPQQQQEQPQSPPVPPQIATLEQFVALNPDDLDARLELASFYIMQQEMMKVWEQTSYVLEREPDHPRAKGYQAVVRLAMGQTDMALRMLEEAIAADPGLLDARIHLALAYLQMGRPQEAVGALEEAKDVHPAQSAMLDELVSEIERQWPEARAGG